MKEYEFLIDKYAKDKSKVDIIGGLLIAQAICSRKLIEGHNQGILDVMGNIIEAIENIKEQ